MFEMNRVGSFEKDLCIVNVHIKTNGKRFVRTVAMTAATDWEIEDKLKNWLRIVRLGHIDVVEDFRVVKRTPAKKVYVKKAK